MTGRHGDAKQMDPNLQESFKVTCPNWSRDTNLPCEIKFKDVAYMNLKDTTGLTLLARVTFFHLHFTCILPFLAQT